MDALQNLTNNLHNLYGCVRHWGLLRKTTFLSPQPCRLNMLKPRFSSNFHGISQIFTAPKAPLGAPTVLELRCSESFFFQGLKNEWDHGDGMNWDDIMGIDIWDMGLSENSHLILYSHSIGIIIAI